MSTSEELASVLVGMNFTPIANFVSSLRFNDTGRTENCVWVSTARYLRFQTVSQLESSVGITAPPGGATYNQILGFLNAICEAQEVRFSIMYDALMDSPGEYMVGYGRADGTHHCVLREPDGRFMDYQCNDDGIDVSGELSMPGTKVKLSWNLIPYDPSVDMKLGEDPSESENEGSQTLSKRQVDSDDSGNDEESEDERLGNESDDDEEEEEEEEGNGDEPGYLGLRRPDDESSGDEESDDEANYRSDKSEFEVPVRHESRVEESEEEESEEEESEEEESEEEESEEEEGRGDEPEYLGFRKPDNYSSGEDESDDEEGNYRSDQSEFEVPARY